MTPIELAIAQTERYLVALDGKAARAAWGASIAKSDAWRSRWLSALGQVAQCRENTVYLLNGLKAVQYRPELARRRPMLKMALRRPAPMRKQA